MFLVEILPQTTLFEISVCPLHGWCIAQATSECMWERAFLWLSLHEDTREPQCRATPRQKYASFHSQQGINSCCYRKIFNDQAERCCLTWSGVDVHILKVYFPLTALPVVFFIPFILQQKGRRTVIIIHLQLRVMTRNVHETSWFLFSLVLELL